MQRTRLRRWFSAIVSIAVALIAVGIFGFIGYKLIGAAGAMGIAVLLAGLALNALMIKAEDMSDGIEEPSSSKRKK